MTLSTNQTKNIFCVFMERKNHRSFDVSGFFGKYKFSATIQDRKSEIGIDGGRIVVLTVWRVSKTVKRISKTVNFTRDTERMSYNRGWIMYPKLKKETKLLYVIMHCLKRWGW